MIGVWICLVGCGAPGLGTLSTSKYSATPVVPNKSSTAARCRSLLPTIESLADEHGIDHSLVVAVARVESRFKARAGSGAGAVGLMQVMPSTGRWFKCGELRDPVQNLTCGIRILKRYLKRYDGNLTYGLAAYNSGPRSADKHRRAGILPRNYRYVQKVLSMRSKYVSKGCF